MKRLIVVDVSNFIFRAFFAIRPLTSPKGLPVNAVYGVLTMFLKLLSQYRPTHILMARDTPGGSFRNEIYDLYKANRSEPPEDLIPQFSLIKELIEKMGLPCAEDDRYEADDIIGSAVTQFKDHFDEVLIASGDKDLMQFVGGNIKMLDTMKDKIYDSEGVFEKMGVRPEQIIDYLSMVGDASDNIPGMKGIGAKGAAKLLAEYGSFDEAIAHKEKMKGKKLITAFGEYLEDGLLSRKLIQIVTDISLGLEADDLKVDFYPRNELFQFLEEMGFKSAIRKLEDLKKAEFDAQNSDSLEQNFAPQSFRGELISSSSELDKLYELIDSVESCAVHTEYDSGDIFERKLSSITISVDGKISSICFFGEAKEGEFPLEQGHKLLQKIWGDSDLSVSSDHWKRDFFYALEQGLKISCHYFDITQAHYILNPGGRHDIISLSKEYIDYELHSRKKKDPFLYEYSEEERIKFLGDRAGALFLLTEFLKTELEGKNLDCIYREIDAPLIPILAQMEYQGISLDEKIFEDLEIRLEKLLSEVEEKIQNFVEGGGINLNSPKQVSDLLFGKLDLPIVKKTKTGYSTDSEVLENLDRQNLSPVPGLILKYREYGKLLSTYVRTLPLLRHERDKRVHTHFNQDVAATGRLSSTNPNLQNIPTRTDMGKEVRKGLISRPGYIFIGADYSQVELRLLAHFSRDEIMIKAFKNGEDIHRQTASEVLGVPLSSVTKEERSKAKAVNFGLMYGQSSFGLASQLKISRKEAKEYITNYFERFSRVKVYLDSLKEKAQKDGYSLTMMGRKRFLPDIYSKNRTIKAAAERVAINSPIQGTAADIIKKAMIQIEEELKKRALQSRMILQIHDELILEVPENFEVEEVKKVMKEAMENVVELSIPLSVEMAQGKSWFDLK